MSKDTPMFDGNLELLKPSQVIFAMLEEGTRRTDLNADGEFGVLPGGTMWYHKALADRIDEYIERLNIRKD